VQSRRYFEIEQNGRLVPRYEVLKKWALIPKLASILIDIDFDMIMICIL